MGRRADPSGSTSGRRGISRRPTRLHPGGRIVVAQFGALRAPSLSSRWPLPMCKRWTPPRESMQFVDNFGRVRKRPNPVSSMKLFSHTFRCYPHFWVSCKDSCTGNPYPTPATWQTKFYMSPFFFPFLDGGSHPVNPSHCGFGILQFASWHRG